MPFPASSVGLELARTDSVVDVRRILAYAAGLGAFEPAFLDDAGEQTLRALPFQCVSLEWPGLLSLRAALADRLSPQESRRGVHAIQDSFFHRPIVPGDRLATTGRLVSARRIRAGVLTVCKFETRDFMTGEAVTTSWSSSIYRDVELEGAGVTIDAAPVLPSSASEPLPAGMNVETITIPRGMPHVYSECADIWNPIHTERSEALAAGLPDIILHGTATWALAGLSILRRECKCDVRRLKRMSGRFSGMIIPGEDVELMRCPDKGGVTRFAVASSTGAPAISQGIALVGAIAS